MTSSIAAQIKGKVKSIAYRNYYLAKYHYSMSLNRSYHKKNEIIFIYQMGKVGSKTVLNSLKTTNLDIPIHHIHSFEKIRLDDAEKILKREFQVDHNPRTTLWDSYFYRNKLDQLQKSKNLKIITLVRDPVARNFSHFFNWPNMIIRKKNDKFYAESPVYNYKEILDEGSEDILISTFINKMNNHSRILEWFDMEIKKYFNIDVYATEFPKDRGYEIYNRGNVSVLLIKLEKLNEIAEVAFREFLGVDVIKIKNQNLGENKEYSSVYKRFKECVKLPESYLDLMYKSKFALHFYSNEEISSFRKRWSRAL